MDVTSYVERQNLTMRMQIPCMCYKIVRVHRPPRCARDGRWRDGSIVLLVYGFEEQEKERKMPMAYANYGPVLGH